MLLKIRKTAMALGAAALLVGQAAHAAPAQPAPAVDPLVAVSILGTPQSRAAVCAGSATCGLPATASTTPAAASPAVTTAAGAAAVQNNSLRRESRGLFWIFLIGGGMILIAVLVAALAGDEDDQPVSPE